MKLYHGSNMSIENPKVIESGRNLDFGSAFYLTSSFDQASKWASLTTRRKGFGTPTVTVYEFDPEKYANYKVKRFITADREWLEYITQNRQIGNVYGDFDIVIGPVADDKTMPVLRYYFTGIYDIEDTLKRLMPQKLKDQYAFKTEDALQELHFQEGILV